MFTEHEQLNKMNKLKENYDKALHDIYDHVGFKEDWVVFPIDTQSLKFYWGLDTYTVKYADSVEEFITETGNCYEDEIYTQCFYKKWVYEGEDFTMVFCDPHVDGMKWFRLFDNKKRIK